jgi:hypothetical protein
MADRLGIAHQVEFTGFRDDVAALIEGLDVLVHASTTGEPCGQAVLEGMAAGKPVVATAGGGIPEIVLDGVTGLLVPMGSARAMAEAVCRLLEDPEAARRMGASGRQRVGEHFTIQNTSRMVQRMYDELLGEPASTRRPRPAPASDSAAGSGSDNAERQATGTGRAPPRSIFVAGGWHKGLPIHPFDVSFDRSEWLRSAADFASRPFPAHHVHVARGGALLLSTPPQQVTKLCSRRAWRPRPSSCPTSTAPLRALCQTAGYRDSNRLL